MALHLAEKTSHGPSGVTKQIKAKKCQLERVRRQRINDRLEKLKIIVMKHLGNDVGFYPPMEKADILELAIRCLEGKENELSERPSPGKQTDNKLTQRSPLRQRNENTQSPKTEREIEVTPIRQRGLSKTALRTLAPQFRATELGNDVKQNTLGQSRQGFKPLLNHPINSITKCSTQNDIPRMVKSCQSTSYTSSLTQAYPLQTIWRPWTQ